MYEFIEGTNEEDEAIKIIEEIQSLISECRYRDMAVLYRANMIEEALLKRKIPYHIENGMTFYEKPEVKTLLDYLRLIHDPDSPEGDDALKSALFVPNRYVSRRFISQIEEYAGPNNYLYQALKTMPVDVPYLRNNIRDFIRLIDSMMEIKDMTEPSEMIMMLRDAVNPHDQRLVHPRAWKMDVHHFCIFLLNI